MTEVPLVVVHENEPVIGTFELSRGFGIEHRSVIAVFNKYIKVFGQFGITSFEMTKMSGKKGRPIKEYLLNEAQAILMGNLVNNTPQAVEFKTKLVSEFIRIRTMLKDLLAQPQNVAWLETRQTGKVSRREETDKIKEFVVYAKAQGSLNAEMYYMSITKMENHALFFLEQRYPNLRDVLNIHQLMTIKSADSIVKKAIADGMERGLKYQDVFLLAKDRVEKFAELIGKSTVASIPYYSKKASTPFLPHKQ